MRFLTVTLLIVLITHSFAKVEVNDVSDSDSVETNDGAVCKDEIDFKSWLQPEQKLDHQQRLFSGRNFRPSDLLPSARTDFSQVKVVFAVSMFETFTYSLDKLSNIVHNPEFKADRPTAIYIHGWLQDGETEISAMGMRSAYRDRGDENVVTLDWSAYSKIKLLEVAYKGSIEHLKNICEELANQLDMIRKSGFVGYESIYLVGHSLGGQCAGLVGRTLKKISNGQFELARIYALDPARPGFEANELPTGLFTVTLHLIKLGTDGFDCLSKTDAKYVQIIHTNGGELGMLEAQGHSDFFPNGGSVQRGCEGMSKMMCFHQRSWIYFQESVRNYGAFRAVKCRSYEEFQNGACDYNTLAVMGYSNKTLPVGKYYLITHANQFHAGMGYDGLKDRKVKDISDDSDAPRFYEPRSLSIPREGQAARQIPSDILSNSRLPTSLKQRFAEMVQKRMANQAAQYRDENLSRG